MKFPLVLAVSLMSFIPALGGAEEVSMSTAPQKCAILLHGLGRTSWSMNKIARTLRKNGYVVWNESYPSTKKSIAELAPVITEALHFCKEQNTSDVYIVTHSLGGILARFYFQGEVPPELKKIVMLAPPNKGSEVADAYKEWLWYQWFTGPAGQELGTDALSVPNTLKPIAVPVGVIAGTVSSDPWFSNLFSGANDGKVSVDSAQLEEMTDFVTVDSGHTFIMRSDIVIEQILYFFENNSFKK